MSTESIKTFELMTNASVGSTNALFVGLFVAFLFIVIAWILSSAYKGLGEDNISLSQLGGLLVRSVVMVTIIFFIILS